MHDVTVYGRRSAFNVQKVLWAAGELGLGIDHRNAGGSFGGLDTPEFRAMNPHGRIPVLVDQDVIVWESHSILRYLGARHGSLTIWPDQPAARSLCDRWMDWSLATLQPDFMRLFWGWFRTPERDRKPALVESARRACEEHFDLLDAELASRPFLAGSEFSLGDIPAGVSLYRYFEMGVDVARPPRVMDWYARLCERPAYREHVMVDFEALRGSLEY